MGYLIIHMDTYDERLKFEYDLTNKEMEIHVEMLKENENMNGITNLNNKVGTIDEVVSKEIGIRQVKRKIGKKIILK